MASHLSTLFNSCTDRYLFDAKEEEHIHLGQLIGSLYIHYSSYSIFSCTLLSNYSVYSFSKNYYETEDYLYNSTIITKATTSLPSTETTEKTIHFYTDLFMTLYINSSLYKSQLEKNHIYSKTNSTMNLSIRSYLDQVSFTSHYHA